MSHSTKRRSWRLLALMALAAGGGSVFSSCPTRLHDDVLLGVRSYFINDFLVSLTCGLSSSQDTELCTTTPTTTQ